MATLNTLRCFLLAILPALVVAGATPRAPASQFMGSCNPSSIKLNGVKLTATCYNIVGDGVCSTLDLTKCLKNQAGAIYDDPEGKGPSVATECTGCTNQKQAGTIGVDSPQIMRCQCDNKLGLSKDRWPVALFDLNTVVDNSNGMMLCHSVKAGSC